MRTAAARLLSSIFLLVASNAFAQQPTPSALEDARSHHRKAVVHFNLDEWKPAAEEFKEAYRLHPDPLFLYNIGQCYRKLGDNGEAISFYKKYLRAAPTANNRVEVERRIEELEAAVAAAGKAREAPPANVISAAETEPPRVAPSLPDLSPPPPPVAALDTRMPDAPESPPIYKRWWFWTAVGGAAAVAVTVALLAGSSGGRSGFIGDLPPGRIPVPSP
jgi:tetratricopeptide (TPR) repeat protein